MVIPQSIKCDCCGKIVTDGTSFQIKKYPIEYGKTRWASRCDFCDSCMKLIFSKAKENTDNGR